MLTDFYIKQGDTAPMIVIACEDENGSVITDNLTSAAVEFHMMTAAGSVVVAAGLGTVVDNTAKTVGYQWGAGDTAVASPGAATPHQAEFQITLSNGLVLTVPNSSNISVHVYPQIA